MNIAPLPSPLASRLASLPLVLAGPILRRVQANQVTVWIALKSAQKVVLKVIADTGQTLWSTPLVSTFQIGKNLHLLALTARPLGAEAPLQPDKIYYYDLEFEGFSGLAAAGVLTASGGNEALLRYVAYAGGARLLPSFSLPPSDINRLRIAHGSCRKPHTIGPDALRTLDILLTNVAHNPLTRIHQLFMTGDQIYADDVADPLLRLLTDAGDTLLDKQEALPGFQTPKRPSDLLPGTRLMTISEMQADAGGHSPKAFTSDPAGASHLIGLGEYLSMYLFCWSDVLWPPNLPTFAQTYDKDQEHPKEADFLETHLSPIVGFRRSLSRVRRVLANIPTYMLFDDHEVTDDWYLHRLWARRVFDKPLARRILQNGLVAYSFCQAWGNTPEAFIASEPGAVLLSSVVAWVQAGMPQSSPPLDEIRRRLPLPSAGFSDTQEEVALLHLSDELRFDFRIEWHKHQLLAFDTRTWRSYRRAAPKTAALFTQAGIDRQLSNLPAAIPDGITIVLLPGPGWLPPKIETVVDLVTIGEDLTYTTDGVFEGLKLDVFAYEHFLSRLAYRPVAAGAPLDQRYVFLSGDVHMGFAARLRYWSEKRIASTTPELATLVIASLTSSGFKKQDSKTQILHSFGFDAPGSTLPPDGVRLVWDVPGASGALRVAKADLVEPLPNSTDKNLWAQIDRHASMAVIPDRVRALNGLHAVRFHPEPGFPRPDRISSLQLLPSTLQRIGPGPPDIDRIDNIPTGGDTTARRNRLRTLLRSKTNAIDNKKAGAPGKQLVGVNNVGVVTFSGFGTPSPQIVQELWWWRVDGALLQTLETEITGEIPADAIARHEVSLALGARPVLDKA